MPSRDPDPRPMGGDRDEADLEALRGGGSGDLGRLGDIVRSLTPDDLARHEPPPAVWQAIAARTGTAPPAGTPSPPAPAPTATTTGTEAPEATTPERPSSETGPPAPLRSVEGGRPTTPHPGRHRTTARRPRRTWGLAAAAAALVLVVVVGAVALTRDDDTGSVVATADLEPLPDEPTGAATPTRADLVDHDGRLQLDLSTTKLPTPPGYYEIWLIDTAIEGMVSLGPARADGTYTVPPDVDPADYPIVDVSIEPPDGNPTHSGVSVLRGTLT